MKFYTLLKIATNAATDDSIAVGAICFDGERLHTYISDTQKKIASKLLSSTDVDLNFILTQVYKKVTQINTSESDIDLFSGNKQKYSQPNFYNYLSRYSNGVLQFSDPNILATEIVDVDKLFKYLFKRDFDLSHTISGTAEHSFRRDIVERKLIQRVSEKVHTDYKFDKTIFDNLYFNYELDCIGKNGSLVGAKSYDFNKSYSTIDKDISHYFTLISSLSRRYKVDNKKNNFYLITEEPTKSDKKNKELFDTLVKNPIIKVLHPEESDLVAEKIEEKKATLFLD
jgi:hypothetical protein